MSEIAAETDRIARMALEEDIGDGDRTTLWTVPDEARGTAAVLARAAGTIAGVGFADRVFELVDAGLERVWARSDGSTVSPGDEIGSISGALSSILTGERTALNGLARLSGIATLAARFVAAIDGTGATLVDTRKTTPGWRSLEKAATAAGGAANHRMGLYDMVLVKENHIRAAGGVIAALDAVRERAAAKGLLVEIEVTTLAELDDALTRAPDRILLDNMELDVLREAVARARGATPRPLLEASGGVHLDTIRAVAETGVDLVSVGAITHSAPALDLSLLVVR